MVDVAAFCRNGALHVPGALSEDEVDDLCAIAGNGPGARLRNADLPALIAAATEVARRLVGEKAFPVRAVMFDKTADANWAVAWHQDRTIVVRERCDVEGFGPWSRKGDLQHVAPPISVLNAMATLRIHMDPCGADNAPLKAALGSHRLGLVPARDAGFRAIEHELLVCLASPGDVWAYSTPILHASDRAKTPSRRRVLQVDYATTALPGGLEWAGIASQNH